MSKKRDSLSAKLYEVGICPVCYEERKHSVSKPFSVCSCGTTEDAGDVPLIQKLRAAIDATLRHPFVPSPLVQQINEIIK